MVDSPVRWTKPPQYFLKTIGGVVPSTARIPGYRCTGWYCTWSTSYPGALNCLSQDRLHSTRSFLRIFTSHLHQVPKEGPFPQLLWSVGRGKAQGWDKPKAKAKPRLSYTSLFLNLWLISLVGEIQILYEADFDFRLWVVVYSERVYVCVYLFFFFVLCKF